MVPGLEAGRAVEMATVGVEVIKTGIGEGSAVAWIMLGVQPENRIVPAKSEVNSFSKNPGDGLVCMINFQLVFRLFARCEKTLVEVLESVPVFALKGLLGRRKKG